MTEKRYAIVPDETLKSFNRDLESTDHGEKDGNIIILAVGATFSDGYQVDIKIVAGDPTPYVDAVLFDDGGGEVMCLEPCFEQIEGEYTFMSEEKTYSLIVIKNSECQMTGC